MRGFVLVVCSRACSASGMCCASSIIAVTQALWVHLCSRTTTSQHWHSCCSSNFCTCCCSCCSVHCSAVALAISKLQSCRQLTVVGQLVQVLCQASLFTHTHCLQHAARQLGCEQASNQALMQKPLVDSLVSLPDSLLHKKHSCTALQVQNCWHNSSIHKLPVTTLLT